MSKIIFVLTLSLTIAVSVFAQSSGPLHGQYSETSSTAQVGNEQLKYWLYTVPSFMTFDDIVVKLCEYLENELPLGKKKGWPIYWDNTQEWNSNPNLANSVKTMMTRLKRNVSMTIIEYVNSDTAAPPKGMYINYYDSRTDTYSTLYFSCYL
jgi:hypothetical protein